MFKTRFVLQKMTLIFLFIAMSLVFFTNAMALTPDEILNMIGGNDPRIWVGEITITRTGRENQKETSPGYSYTKTRQVKDTVVIKACGTIGNMRVSDAKRTLTDKMTKSMISRGNDILCDPPKEDIEGGILKRSRNPNPTYGPGHSAVEQKTRELYLYEEKGAPSVRDTAAVNIMIISGNRAIITGDSRALVTETSDSYREDKAGCTGKTKKVTIQVIPGKYKGKVSVVTSGASEEDDGSFITTIQPPFSLPAAFAKEIKIGRDADSIKGNVLVGEIKPSQPGFYQEKVTAQWEFTATNPCTEVYNEMIKDLAWAEAFLNTKAHESAKDIDQYTELVEKIWYDICYRIFKQKEPNKNDIPAPGENHVSTDAKCETHKLKDYKKLLEDTCKPDVLYKALYEHEKTHRNQCLDTKTYKDFISGIPRNHGLFEVFAHLAGVRKYLGWLENYCPEYKEEVAKARSKAAHIKRIASKMRKN